MVSRLSGNDVMGLHCSSDMGTGQYWESGLEGVQGHK